MTLYLKSQGVDKLVIVGVATDFWSVPWQIADRTHNPLPCCSTSDPFACILHIR